MSIEFDGAGAPPNEELAEQVASLLARRILAREAKDFATADAIRGELDALGVVVMDSATGATWRMKEPA